MKTLKEYSGKEKLISLRKPGKLKPDPKLLTRLLLSKNQRRIKKKKKQGKSSAVKSDTGVTEANLAVKVKTSKKSDKKAKSKG